MRTLSVVLLCSMACSPLSGGTPARDTGTATDTDTSRPADMGAWIDSGGRRDTSLPDTGIMECDSVAVEAMESFAPIDIVWVVDNSGSMRGEADIVQANMNDFAATIAAAGLDIRVVLITAPGYVEVPPPLGTDPERFLRIGASVSSNAALQQLVATYPMYSDFLRPSANLHFIGVTDDESDLAGTAFQTMMEGTLGRTFRFHSIVSPPGSRHSPIGGFFEIDGCEGPNGSAADNGDQYWPLSMRTGGLQLSICTADWSRLFADLSRAIAVAETLPCVYEIPDPPEGEMFDPNRVNVTYTPGGGGAEQTFPNVGSPDRCSVDGWYYEGTPPERIILCPNTCTRLEADMTGRVDIAFGCATLLL